ncbi:MAG: Gx transporter family protein [Clostridia bacterium]|nr:Gx transporter family protein [Clostridia bacterium]
MMAKRISKYGLLACLCLIFGYIESFVPLAAGVPGIKLGLANSVALILIARGDIKGAFAVNITRILLSAFLFGSPFSLIFSLSGALGSMAVMVLLFKLKKFSVIGLSAAGGALHNIFQLLAALFIIGKEVLYYLPLLIVAGGISGTITGWVAFLILKKMKTIGKE